MFINVISVEGKEFSLLGEYNLPIRMDFVARSLGVQLCPRGTGRILSLFVIIFTFICIIIIIVY